MKNSEVVDCSRNVRGLNHEHVFCNIERITGKSVWGMSMIAEDKQNHGRSLNTQSPFFKGLLHWTSPWGQQALLSWKIHPPCWHLPLVQEGGRMKWGITDSSPPFPHTLHFSLILFFYFWIIWLVCYFQDQSHCTFACDAIQARHSLCSCLVFAMA